MYLRSLIWDGHALPLGVGVLVVQRQLAALHPDEVAAVLLSGVDWREWRNGGFILLWCQHGSYETPFITALNHKARGR